MATEPKKYISDDPIKGYNPEWLKWYEEHHLGAKHEFDRHDMKAYAKWVQKNNWYWNPSTLTWWHITGRLTDQQLLERWIEGSVK